MRKEIYDLTQRLRSRAYPIQVSQGSVEAVVEDMEALLELYEIARELGWQLDYVSGDAWPEGRMIYAFRAPEEA